MNRIIILVIVGVAVLAVVGYVLVTNIPEEQVSVSTSNKVSVVLDWFPWPAHAGLYAAQERGYFADEGLEVEIRVPSDPATVLQTVASGRDDFGLSYQAESLLAREQKIPVVSVMAILQRPLSSFMSLKESGITSPKQLAGKKIGTSGLAINERFLDTMLKRDGVAEGIEAVEMVNVGFDLVTALVSKQVDALGVGYWSYEPLVIQKEGYQVNIMKVEDYGVPNFYEIILVTNEDKISKEPELVQRFVRATKRGYEDAMANPQAGVQVMKEKNSELDLETDSASVVLMAPTWKSENGVFGWQEESRWVSFAQWMKDSGVLQEDVDASKAFTNSFIENAR